MPQNSGLAAAVIAKGGSAVRCGLFNGYDMATSAGLAKAVETFRKLRPRRLLCSPPCSADSVLQNLNQNNSDLWKKLKEKRRVARRIRMNIKVLIEEALKAGDTHIE